MFFSSSRCGAERLHLIDVAQAQPKRRLQPMGQARPQIGHGKAERDHANLQCVTHFVDQNCFELESNEAPCDCQGDE
jgi:hypothetical protein